MSAAFTFEKSRVVFSRLRVGTKESTVDLTGVLDNLRAPRGTFAMKATVAVREMVRMLNLPIDPVGTAVIDGELSVAFDQPFDWNVRGRLTARGLRYRHDRIKIEDAEVRGNLQLQQTGATLRQMTVQAFGTEVSGEASLAQWRQVHVEGTFAGTDLRRAVAILTDHPVAWNGTLAGSFGVDSTLGQTNSVVHVSVGITPDAAGVPLQGQIDLAYDQAGGTLALGSSSIATPATRLEVSGTLGQMMQVRLRSTSLDDILPALAIVEDNPPAQIPLKLKNGSVTADGSVTGPLDNLKFTGQATVSNGEIQGHGFDRFTGEIEADGSRIQGNQLVLARGPTEITGSATLTARQGVFDDAAVTAQLNIRNASLADLAHEAGSSLEITGTGSATVTLTGSVTRPDAQIALDVQSPAAFGEQIDRLRANVHYTPAAVELTNGVASAGPSGLEFSATYRHPENDLKSGDLNFDLVVQNLVAARVQHIAKIQPPLDAVIAGRASGTGRIANGVFDLTAATANLSAQRVTVDRQPIGDLSLTAETRGTQLTVRAGGKVRESSVEANGEWTLQGDSPGRATVTFSRMSINTVHDLVMLGDTGPDASTEPPFEGFIEGGATVTVALQKPTAFTANVTLSTIQVNPRPEQQLKLDVKPQDVVLKNSQPLVVEISKTAARIVSAQFTGRDTNFTVTGSIPFDAASRADLALRGNIDLPILQLWNSDLLAKGSATVAATIRGNLRDPSVNGRLELNKASLFMTDLPNGVENVSGTILFDRNRATIEDKLTADTGGGKIEFTGNLDFGSTLTYRLQASAKRVRLRWPEDVSTTFDASLRLTGTSQASTVSGSLTLDRVVFNPRTDLFQLLAQASKPAPAPVTPSDYLRGMQLDVRIDSGPTFELETSLTRDVEADVGLRLRGTPVRPVLQGTISINEGEVQVLGARYTVNRGEIRFLNPVTVEPSFDMDLETKARGVTVDVTLSGTTEKLKVNYSSDPPLQSSEIVALLTVGRDPTLGSSQTAPGLPSSSTSDFLGAGGGLLGQAVSAQLSSRVQRVFGASHVKIDPTLTGVDNLPQARVTLEQQVSKDITLTYITNLNRTQEQIVQVQWDLDRNWSAIAVRDPAGFFGIDFQFRKRLK